MAPNIVASLRYYQHRQLHAMAPSLNKFAEILHCTTVDPTFFRLNRNRDSDFQILAKGGQHDLKPEKEVWAVARVIVDWFELDADLPSFNG